MLRINLLPAYIAERKKTTTAIVLASVLWLLVLGLGLGYYFGSLSPQVADAETAATKEQAAADAVTKYAADTDTLREKIKPLKDKVDFVKLVRFHNQIRQKIYRNAARYTYKNVEYNQMAINDRTLVVSAFVKNVSDLGRFYINMFGNPDVTAVSIQVIPSWPPIQQQQPGNPFGGGPSPAEAGWFPVQLTATLVRPVVLPQLPASLFGGGTGAAGGGGMGVGGPPMMGGYGGGPPMMGGYGGGGAGYGGPPPGALPSGAGAPAGGRAGGAASDK